MIDIFDLIHYLIGLFIVGFLVWLLIRTHEYFSKNNVPIVTESFKNQSNSKT